MSGQGGGRGLPRRHVRGGGRGGRGGRMTRDGGGAEGAAGVVHQRVRAGRCIHGWQAGIRPAGEDGQRRAVRQRRPKGADMATKADFTESEWEQLHNGVTGAGLLVSLSDRSFFDNFKEARAIAKHLSDARQHSDSLLVRDLAAEHGTGFSVRSHPEEIESKTLDYLRSSVTLLQTKAPEDLDDYRILVMDVAESVAAAAKGGDEAEAAEVEKIRQAVGGRPG